MSRQFEGRGPACAEEPFPFTPMPADDGLTLAPREVVYTWDIASDAIAWGANPAAIIGIDGHALATGCAYADHLVTGSPSSRDEAIATSSEHDAGHGVPYTAIYGMVRNQRSSEPPVWVEDSGRWFADAFDRPGRAHGIIRVISERFEAERLLAASERLEKETGTFTRAYLVEQLARQLSLNQRAPSSFAVLLIAVAPAADETSHPGTSLKPVLERLRRQMRAHEILAHYSAERFAVLLENCNSDQAASAGDRFIQTIAEEPCEGIAYAARVGAVISPGHGRTPQALLQYAEKALQTAREPAGPRYVRYEAVAPGRGGWALQTSSEILSALSDHRVVLALQPIVDAKTRSVALYEALVRIKRANGSLVMPDALVPQAEKNGLVPLIDRRVLELAFGLLTADRKRVLSVNASVVSLNDGGWLDHLRASCKLRPDAARRLTIEITETGVIADIEAARVALAAIRMLGVKIAIDDFGSGHSSFRNLRELPIDYLKIDGAFSQNLASSADDRFFIRTLIDLARNLRIPTVAEWVEDAATAQLLTDWGVNYLQGHLFGRAEVVAPLAPPAG